MKFLIDNSADRVKELAAKSHLVGGQLLTPLTRFNSWGGTFAIDNGAFTKFDRRAFLSLLTREAPKINDCLFVVAPDVVGSARRTLELWKNLHHIGGALAHSWNMAFVAQDGCENMDMPWSEFDWLFIGGRDPWKDSQAVEDLIKTAKILSKQVHVGRVNTPARYYKFANLGCDTCDGSGVSRYDHMLEAIEAYGSCQEVMF